MATRLFNFYLKTNRAPGLSEIPVLDHVTMIQFESQGCILPNFGGGLILNPGNGFGREQGSFLLLRVFFYGK